MASTSDESVKVIVRERQWLYLGPIAAAPLAHICVTLYHLAKTPRQKKLLLVGGVVGSTVMTISMRLWLMGHAGYPGMEAPHKAQSRIKMVNLAEKEEIERPSATKQFKEALRGFG